MSDNFKVCYITAIYGNYETSCKPFFPQTVESDFICFTDNTNIDSNGWTIDTTPYHITHKSPLDNNTYVNSISNNQHTFNIAKYYKQQFQRIPRLQQYDVIVWLDGTIRITNPFVSEYIKSRIFDYKIIGWMHEYRRGILLHEVIDSDDCSKYTSRFWYNQPQPFQDVYKQYGAYISDGFMRNQFQNSQMANEFNHMNLGVWLTCFVAFLNKDPLVTQFLDLWYLQTLMYTTQDQIGFPYVCYKTGLVPYTLPDAAIKGANPHWFTDFYEKVQHGQ